MNEQQNEVPEWAKGEGWAWDAELEVALYDRRHMKVDNDGHLLIQAGWEWVIWQYATPEKARQVADAILDGLL